MAGLENQVLVAKNVNFDHLSNPPHNGIVTADGQLLIGSTANPNIAMVANTLTAGTGITITNGPGTITVASTAASTDLHTARFIVASSTAGTGANFTTIAAAIAAAQGTGINSTIFLQPGTYTENFSLPAGINLCAYICDANTPNVTIVGTITKTTAGTSSISGIRLQTNSAALLAVTGSAASIVNLDNCYLNCTNNTGITFSTSSGSAQINIKNCNGNLGTTGIGFLTHTSAGTFILEETHIFNSGGSSTSSTCSAGVLNIFYSLLNHPITTSGTASVTCIYTDIDTSVQNATSFTAGGSGAHFFRYCRFNSGTASSFSSGSTTPTISDCTFTSSNTNAVTGAGTAIFNLMSFEGTSSGFNTTTQTSRDITVGRLRSPTQPCFAYYLNSSAANVTGDGTSYTVLFDTVIFDQASNFNTGTGTFTAPVAGRYLFTFNANFTSLGAGHTQGLIQIVTTGRTYNFSQLNYAAIRDSSNAAQVMGSVIANMASGDTAIFKVQINSSTKTVGVAGAGLSFISGSLLF